jgi:ketosteroid isomerase-like protein
VKRNGRLRLFFIISTPLLASAALLLTARVAKGNPPQNVSGDTGVEQEVKDFDRKWLHAASTHDGDTLREIFADGMFEVQKGGVVVTGAEMRKTLTAPGRNIQIDIDQIEVRGIYGNTAVLTDRTKQEGVAPDGRKISGLYTVLRVLNKQNGAWRAIGAEMTPLQQSTAATPMLNGAGAAKDTQPASDVEKELIDLDHKWVDAATKGDTQFLRSLFGERMFEVQPGGHAASAEEMLKGIATRKPGQIEGYCDQIQIRGIYGDTAILTDRRVRKGIAADGRDVSGQWRVTRVFVKQEGKWRAVAGAMAAME